MSIDQPPSHTPPERASDLPESHLALVIEDAVAAVDTTSDQAVTGIHPLPNPPPSRGRGQETGPDLRLAWLYGWATGIGSSQALALLATSDNGLRYLLRGTRPSAHELRTFRGANERQLRDLAAEVFYLLSRAGVSSLGLLPLPAPPADDPAAEEARASACADLARDLVEQSASADQFDTDRPGAMGSELPAALQAREPRRQALRDVGSQLPADLRPILGGSSPLPSTERTTARPHRMVRALAMLATLVILFAGLLVLRWLSSSSAFATGAAQPSAPAPPTPVVRLSPTPAADVTGTPEAGDEMTEARDEAMRLAQQSLEANDLQGAHDFYYLALQAVPDDEEASDRLRQVETAMDPVGSPQTWEETVVDIADLRQAAPDSDAVLQSYVTALVGLGRRRLASGERDRAAVICGDAVAALPSRADAQACLAQANEEPTATPLPTATATATVTPVATSTPTPPRPATPIENLLPPLVLTRAAGPPTPVAEGEIRLTLSGSCQPPAPGEAGAGVLRVIGVVTADGGPATDYRLVASAESPAGRTIPLANARYLVPVFQVQQSVTALGTYVVSASAEKDGYQSGEASAEVTCG